MKRGDIFTFTAPNGVEVTGVCLYPIFKGTAVTTYVCYAQDRRLTYEESHCIWEFMKEEPKSKYGEILIDYCVLPDYDEILERYNDIEVAQAETASGM